MKIKITKKELTGAYKNLITIPYCGLQHLLRYRDPMFYNAGVNGWNYDVYAINHNTAIVTGYRTIGNIHPDYETVKKYDDAAWNNTKSFDYDHNLSVCDELIDSFINEVLEA